jgi:hypothetical protein
VESFSYNEFTQLYKFHVLTFLCEITGGKGGLVNNSTTLIPSKETTTSAATHESLKCFSLKPTDATTLYHLKMMRSEQIAKTRRLNRPMFLKRTEIFQYLLTSYSTLLTVFTACHNIKNLRILASTLNK